MTNDNKNKWCQRPELIIAILSLGLALLAYLRPPDPAHPTRFDFLSKTISMPLWVAGVVILATVAICAIVFRRLRKTPKPPVEEALGLPDYRSKTNEPSRIEAIPEVAVPRFVPSLQNSEIVIPTGWECEIHIKVENSSVPVISLRVDNNRIGSIDNIDVIIHSARGFDGGHNQFRTEAAASGFRSTTPDAVVASRESSQSIALAHKPADQTMLFLGNDSQRPMRWPENDKTVIHRWKLNISIGARAYTRTIPPTGEVFQRKTFDLIVDWDTEKNKLASHQA